MIRFSCTINETDVEQTLRLGVLADKCGFQFVVLGDHLFHPLRGGIFTQPTREVFTMLTAIATQTKNIKLGCFVDPVRLHPAMITHSVTTLDWLSSGRAVLGIGAGEAFNINPLKDLKWGKPFTRLKEAIILIKKLWASTIEEPVNFQGEYFEVEDAHLGLKPIQKPHPSIYIGGWGPKMLGLVGELGDGWLPWIHTPECLKKDLGKIREAAREAGRDPNKIEVAVMVHAVVLEDGDEARRIALPRSRSALALRRRLLRELGFPKLADKAMDIWQASLTGEEVSRIFEVACQIPEEVVEKTYVAGTVDEVIGQIEEFIEAGVTIFNAMPILDVFEDTAFAFKDEIIPYFREQGR